MVNMKMYFIFLIFAMFVPQVILGVSYGTLAGNLYAIGYLIGMSALGLSQYFNSRR